MGRIGLCVCCLLKFSVVMCNILLVKKLESMRYWRYCHIGRIMPKSAKLPN